MIVKRIIKNSYNAIAILIIVTLLFSSCKSERRIEENRIAMGTNVSITVFSQKDAKLLDDAFLLLSEIERKISSKDPNSYVSKINSCASISKVPVPDDVYSLIKRSVEIANQTDGLFNPAIGALVDLWGIATDNARVPEQYEIDAVLPLLSCSDIVFDDSLKTVYLKKKGMKLDLGAIGKGYAVDKLREYFLSNGVEKAIINLGGNVYVLGWKNKIEREKWRVGIVDPLAQSNLLTEVDIMNKAVSTSGGYERYFESDGIRYHHILSSATGYPTDSDALSATVISPDGALADALSTAAFSGGSEKAKELSEKFSVYIIIYTKSNQILRFGEL